MKVLAINGSARKGGNTFRLLETVAAELRAEDIEVEIVELAGMTLRGCTACFGCAKKKNLRCVLPDEDGLNEIFAKMVAADGILLGSPVYFSDATAGMRALIERCGMVARMNGNPLARKAGAGVVAVRRAGSNVTFSSLNYFFLISQMIVPGSTYWNMGFGREPGEVEKDAEGMESMRVLGKNMAWLLKRLRG